jgi:hypothetical protein
MNMNIEFVIFIRRSFGRGRHRLRY